MVRRQVFVEGRVVEELGATPAGHVGLLVGQLTAERDYVCLRVPTPPAPAADEADPTGGRGKGSVGVAVLSELEDWWLLEHARQVTRVLPGGLEVVGLFVTTPPDAAKGLYPRLRLLLEQLCSVCSASRHLEGPETSLLDSPHTSRVLLQLCPTTSKCVVKTVDVGDKRSSLSPCEAKFQEHSTRWLTLRCVLTLGELLPCPVLEGSEAAMLTQLKSTLTPYLSALVRGQVVWGGEVVDRSGLVVPQSSGRQKGASPSAGGVESVDLYLKQGVSVGDGSVERSPSLRVGGCLMTLAMLSPRATWADAERAIKTDMLRSLSVRLELLSQEMSRQGQEEDPVIKAEEPVKWGFPRRVTVTMDSTHFPLSDYCFEDESDKDCKLRLAELLSVADPSSLEVTDTEGGADLGGGDCSEKGQEGAPPPPSVSAGKRGGHLLGMAGAVLTVGVALVVWWWTQGID